MNVENTGLFYSQINIPPLNCPDSMSETTTTLPGEVVPDAAL